MLLVVLMCVTAAPLDGFVGLDLGFGFEVSALPTTGDTSVATDIGEGITYNIVDGVLTISGTGATDDFGEDYPISPFA